jgi:hypothetical protein
MIKISSVDEHGNVAHSAYFNKVSQAGTLVMLTELGTNHAAVLNLETLHLDWVGDGCCDRLLGKLIVEGTN